MAVGKLRRGHHGFRVGGAQPGDVVGDGAGEKLDILRQVAQMPADIVAPPREDLRPVQPHRAGGRGMQPHQHAGQGRFAGGGGTDHGQRLARKDIEGDACRMGFSPLAAEHQVLDRQAPLGCGQRQAGRPALRTAEEFLKALTGGAGVGDLLPASDRQFDRLKRPAQHDRSGDHGAAGHLVPARPAMRPAPGSRSEPSGAGTWSC